MIFMKIFINSAKILDFQTQIYISIKVTFLVSLKARVNLRERKKSRGKIFGVWLKNQLRW